MSREQGLVLAAVTLFVLWWVPRSGWLTPPGPDTEVNGYVQPPVEMVAKLNALTQKLKEHPHQAKLLAEFYSDFAAVIRADAKAGAEAQFKNLLDVRNVHNQALAIRTLDDDWIPVPSLQTAVEQAWQDAGVTTEISAFDREAVARSLEYIAWACHQAAK